MFREVSAAVVFAVLCVTTDANAQVNADELSIPKNDFQSEAEAHKQSLRDRLSSLENELKEAEKFSQADRQEKLTRTISILESELAALAAAQLAGGLNTRETSDVKNPMQLREEISALAKEYVKAINESTESLTDNARVKEITAKLYEMQAQLPADEAGGIALGFDRGMGGMRGDLVRGRGELDFGRGMGRGGMSGMGMRGMGGGMRGMPAQSAAMEISPTPAQSQLESQVNLLATQLAQSDEATQAAVDKALRKVLAELYESRLQQREDQLKQLEKRVADLRTQLDRQRQAKDEVIDLRVKTMINDAKGLGFLGQPGNQ